MSAFGKMLPLTRVLFEGRAVAMPEVLLSPSSSRFGTAGTTVAEGPSCGAPIAGETGPETPGTVITLTEGVSSLPGAGGGVLSPSSAAAPDHPPTSSSAKRRLRTSSPDLRTVFDRRLENGRVFMEILPAGPP